MVELGVGLTVLPVVKPAGLRPGRVIAERTLVLARRDGAAVDPAAEMLAVAPGTRSPPHPGTEK